MVKTFHISQPIVKKVEVKPSENFDAIEAILSILNITKLSPGRSKNSARIM